MTSILSLLSHPRISTSEDGGKHSISFGMEGWGADVIGTYWQEPRPADLPEGISWDGWRYSLTRLGDKGGCTYSHATAEGCQIMILRHLLDAGLMPAPIDNSHLDARNAEIAAETQAAWDARTGKPRVGDFVIMPNSTLRRCSHGWDDGMQTSDGGSFHISRSGTASMSGSLYPSQLWEYFKETDEVRPGRFWFFSHGMAGAGRGVDVHLPCRVYKLDPFAMTEDEARAHPVAVKAAEFWGDGHLEHQRAIASLMNPAALAGRYC